VTPSRLRTFLAVLDTGSARGAAEVLCVTESAVSAALAALHRELGVTLLERQGRGLRVTEAGQVFAGYARRILGLIEEGAEAARQGPDPARGRLRLAAVTTAGEHLVPGLLATFRSRHPLVELSLEVRPRDDVFALLVEHRVDVAIGGRPPPGRHLVSRASRPNSLIVVAAPGAPPDLETSTWLLREPGSGTRETTLALLASGQSRPPVLTLGSPGAVLASTVLGLGVTLISADAAAPLLHNGELQQLTARGTPLNRPWHAVTGESPTATTRLFLEHLRDPQQAGEFAFRGRSRS
jgi:DNA-binding transcriptional LysR family regulator